MPQSPTLRTRRRSRSPMRSPSSHRHHQRHRSRRTVHAPATLPFESLNISKHDFKAYEPLFGLYLDIQKQLVLDDLDEIEVKGRWKSFVGKWNRGELAEGWYDPATLRKAQASAASKETGSTSQHTNNRPHKDYGSSDEDSFGPALPEQGAASHPAHKKPGPAIPTMQDLDLRKESSLEDSLERREQIRQIRRLDRQQQKERLDELAPKADAGTKDRMLEKKREKADSNRAFASAKTEAGGVEEAPEADLFGDEDGGIEGLKRQKHEMERKRNEREIRRDEILRARQEEREERIREYQAKEEKTMSGLIALAKARFG